MEKRFDNLNTAVHPNAYIAENPDLREFYCLYCAADAAEEASGIGTPGVCRYREGYVLMFTGDHTAEFEAFFNRCKSHAGLCGPFVRAVSAYDCAEKAYMAAAFGGSLYPGTFLHHYSDIRFWAFVELADDIISGEGVSIYDFCLGAVFDICEYDRLEGTNYRATLMAYLSSGCNLRAAGEMIGVHRNTLAYRIKRLEEQFGISLNDSNACFELLFSFTALEAAGIDWESYRKPEPGVFAAATHSRALWDIAERRTPGGQPPECLCRLALIDVSELQEDAVAALYRTVESRFPDAAAAYNDHAVYILAGDGAPFIDDFRSVLDESECRGTVSQAFSSDRLPLHAELLSDTLNIAGRLYPDRTFFSAKDFCSLAFFAYIQRRTAVELYYCDEVMRVMSHDYEKGTSFAKSLYIYLSSFMKMMGAAHEASVHRNTLEYQIKKALSIANIENPDDRLRFEMMCTYKMLIASEV